VIPNVVVSAVTPSKKFVGPRWTNVPCKKPRHPKKHPEGKSNIEWETDIMRRAVLLSDLRSREDRVKEMKAR
jgi:hypothetical protein